MKTQTNLIESLISIVAIFIAFCWAYQGVINYLYTFNVDNIFKSSKNCKDYKKLYILEMKKGQSNNIKDIIKAAHKQSCTK